MAGIVVELDKGWKAPSLVPSTQLINGGNYSVSSAFFLLKFMLPLALLASQNI